jgi:2-polyprenyl-3-methyl-5-hydroxy-6-metoxy-1,4-benzoquinol methylase
MIAEPDPAGTVYDFARPEMEAFVPQGARRVLDVGCSTGRFGERIRARGGVTVVGVEPDAVAAEQARPRLDEVVVGLFPEVEPRLSGCFDAIVFNDVLEHMVEPADALPACRRLLARDGVLVASVPNVRHVTVLGPLLLRGDWRYTEIGILDQTHLRFFTRSSLLEFFQDADWDIVQLRGINRCRRPEVGDTGRLRALSRLTGGRSDPFFFLQYAVVARPGASS